MTGLTYVIYLCQLLRYPRQAGVLRDDGVRQRSQPKN